jgi:hypothetical protein
MKTLRLSHAFMAIGLLSQSRRVVSNPMPVNSKAAAEGKDWASTFSLGASSQQGRDSLIEQRQIWTAPTATKPAALQAMRSEPVDIGLWGSDLSLGGASRHASNPAPSLSRASQELHIMKPARQRPAAQAALRDQLLKKYPLPSAYAAEARRPEAPKMHIDEDYLISHNTHASAISLKTVNRGQSTVPLPGKDRAASSKSKSGLTHEARRKKKKSLKHSEERKRNISEGLKKWHKIKRANMGMEEHLRKQKYMRKEDTRITQAAVKVLDEMLQGYDSQNEKRFSSNNRGAVNKKIEEHSLTASHYGSIWQSMRSEFVRRYPGRKLPGFLQLSSNSRRKKSIRSEAVKDVVTPA